MKRQIALEARSTKNNEPRTIPISGELYQTLVALRSLRASSRSGRDLVFTNQGKPIRYLYDAWRKATAKAGFPGLLVHDCRRTTVRNLVRAGVPDKVAQAISGRKMRSAFDRHNIVDENDLRDATAKLERSLGAIWAQNADFGRVCKEDATTDSEGKKAVTH